MRLKGSINENVAGWCCHEEKTLNLSHCKLDCAGDQEYLSGTLKRYMNDDERKRRCFDKNDSEEKV